MSFSGFIKKYRNPFARELKRKHTAAYLILDTIAENAKRNETITCPTQHPLLEIGEAIITAEECGLTSQKFKTGLKYLEGIGFINVVHRGRKDKNSKLLARIKTKSNSISSLFTSQINGTVAKLLDSSIFDINIMESINQKPNQNSINSGSNPNKQEVKNFNKFKKKDIEDTPPEKIKFCEFVSLSQEEYNKLQEKHGLKTLDEMLNILNSYKGSSGKIYKSDYHTLSEGGWVLGALKRSQTPITTKASNHDQIVQHFKHGEFYNNAECHINEESISFTRGMKHEQLKFKENGFFDQFENMLRKFGIENPLK